MTTADAAAYGWLHEDLAWFGEAACVTVAAGVTREQFVNAFGVDLASPQSSAESGADGAGGLALISFTEVAGCLVAVEVKGSTGSEADVLDATSVTGSAASAFWDAEGTVRFACARDGDVLHDVKLARDGADDGPGGLPPELAGLVETDEVGAADADGQPSPQAVAMALVEAWTGARVSAADIERALTLGYVAES